ncbi:MAG: type II restriction endonuclease [Culicoidibacterales bacterium]
MEARNFDTWLENFKSNISNYDYYTNFTKIYQNIDSIKIELNILNSLIGSKNVEYEFKILVSKYPEVLKCIPILLAVREKEIAILDSGTNLNYSFSTMNYSLEQYCIFMHRTGLFELLSEHLVNNLVDYVTGVETGLDSNGRKNRGGHLMENLVESHLLDLGLVAGISYFKEMKTTEITKKWGVDLSEISNNNKTVKRFDFVVKTEEKIYIIETNFYKSSGSKLNETARSYKNLALETKNIENVVFVWFTDGKGWIDARNNLRETFDVMQHIYSIYDIENGTTKNLFI